MIKHSGWNTSLRQEFLAKLLMKALKFRIEVKKIQISIIGKEKWFKGYNEWSNY
jgi:hypothetical protein